VRSAGVKTAALTIAVLAAGHMVVWPSAAVAQQSAPTSEDSQAETSARSAPPAVEDAVRPRKPRTEAPTDRLLRDLIDVITRPPIERPMDPPEPATLEPFQPQFSPRDPVRPIPEPAEEFEPIAAEPVKPAAERPRPIAPARPSSSAAPPAARPLPPSAAPRVTPAPRPEAAPPPQEVAIAAQSVTEAASAPTPTTTPAPSPSLPMSDSQTTAAAPPAVILPDPESGGRTYWPWLLIVASLGAAAAAFHRWHKHRMLDRTRSALALRPSLDPAEGNCVSNGLALAGPAMSIRSRLEMGSSAWQTR